jgi:hypothetical protein
MRSLATFFFRDCLARIVKLTDGFWDQFDLRTLIRAWGRG